MKLKTTYHILLALTFFVAVVSISQVAWTHGEDKPGPNGGPVRMPGAFHTEAVAESPVRVAIYLLDIEWKNPSIKKSSLKASFTSKSNPTTEAICKPTTKHYVCEFPANVDLNKPGTLAVQASREGQKGILVSYDTPLKLTVVDDGHGSHK